MSSGRDLDLPRRHALMGVPVIVAANFATAGKPTYTPKAALDHHTAGPKTGVAPSLGVVMNGRSDLAGPLCNTLQDRNDVAREIASGKANHGGYGHWNGVTGNSNLFGLEVEYSGDISEPFSAHRFDIMCRIQAGAALDRYDADMLALHLEYAEPHGRKIDFLLAALEPFGGAEGMRNRTQWYIDHPPGLAPVIKKPIIPRLVKTLRVGMVDDPSNPIIRHVEDLVTWNAVKRGHPTENSGQRDGKFTKGRTSTASGLIYFRRWFYDLQSFAGVPEAKRVFKTREFPGVSKGDYSQVVVGPKMLAALEWAAAA